MDTQDRFRWALKCLKLKKDNSVLEIGPGVGIALELIRKTVSGHIAVVERSLSFLKKSKSKLKQGGGDSVTFVHADFRSADLPVHEFDRIFVFNVSLFLKDEAALRKVRECLSDGGCVGIFYQNPPGSSEEKLNRMLSQTGELLVSAGFINIKKHVMEVSGSTPTGGVTARSRLPSTLSKR